MTLPEETAIVAYAAASGVLRLEEIREWAFGIIEASAKPPLWIIELATVNPETPEEMIPMLAPHWTKPPTRMQLQIIIAGHTAGRLSLVETLSRCFQTAILDTDDTPRAPRDEPLVEALITWDCQDDLDIVAAPLAAEFHKIFQRYLADASDVLSILPQLKPGARKPECES